MITEKYIRMCMNDQVLQDRWLPWRGQMCIHESDLPFKSHLIYDSISIVDYDWVRSHGANLGGPDGWYWIPRIEDLYRIFNLDFDYEKFFTENREKL